MIIKEVLNDYKNLYTILHRRIDENEENISYQEYFVREVLKNEKNSKKINSIIEILIPLIIFIIVTTIAILNYKEDFVIKFCIGIVWLAVSIILEIVILMLNIRIINKKVKNRQKATKLSERIIVIEKFLFEFIMISAHISYLIIK